MTRFYIKNLAVNNTNLPDVLERIEVQVEKEESAYICVTNARTVYLSNIDSKYCSIQNNSFLTVPDGIPLIWIANLQGFKNVNRVAGPDLMFSVLKQSSAKNYSHYFYGSTENTIKKMGEKLAILFPDVKIVGLVSPPFQPVDEFDIEGLSKEINELKPTFFWCGLGAPKQEIIISKLQPKLKSTICIGVGLAFEYFAGTVKRPPAWIQRSGLEWFFRVVQQPLRSKRFLKPFFWILGRLILVYLKNLFRFSKKTKDN